MCGRRIHRVAVLKTRLCALTYVTSRARNVNAALTIANCETRDTRHDSALYTNPRWVPCVGDADAGDKTALTRRYSSPRKRREFGRICFKFRIRYDHYSRAVEKLRGDARNERRVLRGGANNSIANRRLGWYSDLASPLLNLYECGDSV